ncbi:MAG: hypothetical protein HKO59_14410, partial [Phycisphaerales bacterium]|nr:hypothetical protein [Phycisphaerales bacterium]
PTTAELAGYQTRAGVASPHQMLRDLEMPVAAMRPLVAHAHDLGMHAIVTVFNVELVTPAEREGFDAYKVASPDIINRPLIAALQATGAPLLVSTGAASTDEIARAVGWLGHHPHVLLHCVSSYPTPDDDAAIGGRMALLALSAHALGYSDHTVSVDTGALAVAGGACVLEKHLTLDRDASGPDHAVSIEPAAMGEYVRLAHRAWRMRGPIAKRIAGIEEDVRTSSRQSITTKRALPAGRVLDADDLTIKRPGTGLSPACLTEVIGRTLRCAVPADVPLSEEHLA